VNTAAAPTVTAAARSRDQWRPTRKQPTNPISAHQPNKHNTTVSNRSFREMAFYTAQRAFCISFARRAIRQGPRYAFSLV
jgi:hypothetical protein